MFLLFRRDVSIPVWAIATGVAAFSAPVIVMRSLVVLIALTVAASAALALGQCLRTVRPARVQILPPLDLDLAVDLNRMDSDAG